MDAASSTNLEHEHEQTIKATTEESLRASIGAGQTPNAVSIAAGMIEAWVALGYSHSDRGGMLGAMFKAHGRWASERITAIRAELYPQPANYARDEAGLLAGSRALDVDLCQCMGEPMIRESGGEWEILTKRSNARERLFRALQRECVDEAGHPWHIRYRDDEFRLLVGTCETNPLSVAIAFAGRVASVTSWANMQSGGNYTYGEIAHAVGLVDRYVGAAKIGKLNAEIVKVGLAAADGEWTYGDVRIDEHRHGERWKCPRSAPVKLAPKRRKRRAKPTPTP